MDKKICKLCRREQFANHECFDIDRMAAEARLEEASDWLAIVESLLKYKRKDSGAQRVLRECRQRVADLQKPVQP